MLISRKRRAGREAFSRILPIVILLASALFGTICSTAGAQGYAADDGGVLQGPRHSYDLLRGPRIEPDDAARAGADYAPRRDGTADPGFPAYGAPLDDKGSAPNYPGPASDPAYARPRSSYPQPSREDGGAHSRDRLQSQLDASPPGQRRTGCLADRATPNPARHRPAAGLHSGQDQPAVFGCGHVANPPTVE